MSVTTVFASGPVYPEFLLLLRDPLAPYRGAWVVEHQCSGLLRASHATERLDGCVTCLIEERYFPEYGLARQFVSHLLHHGWWIAELKEGAYPLIAA